MKIVACLLCVGLVAVNVMAAEEVVIPIAKVDALVVNDAAKANDAKRKAEGVGVVGRVWGYVKDGVIYMASSTKEAIVDHPYVTALTIGGAVLADKNNNWTGLWSKDKAASGGGIGGNSTSTATDNSVTVNANNNGGNVTVVVQSPENEK